MPIDLNQPQIAAAIVGGSVAAVVSLTVAIINLASVRGMHREKLKADQALTELKANADIALAEKKQAADMALARWKRRMELAEEVLTDFYEARDVFETVRHPGSFGDEGASRPRADWEDEDDVRLLNSYFVAVERLQQKSEFFARLNARRHRFMTMFGTEAAAPFDAIFRIRRRLLVAVRMLLTTYRQTKNGRLPEGWQRWQDDIWAASTLDPLGQELAQAIAQIEAICRPVLAETP